MKRILILLGVLVSLTAAQVVFGQTTEGVITYEVKVNLHRTLPKDREEMKSMLPEFRTSADQLYFNASESLFKPLIEDDEDQFGSEDGAMRMRFSRPNVLIYVNPSSSRKVTQQEFMGKKYLIEDTVKLTPWKFGTGTKVILGKECKEATFYNEERKQKIVAWYTDAMRPFLGPENFNTLPGVVLAVDINDGERLIIAKKIDERALKKSELKIPAEGTRITQAAFRKIMDEQMERMRATGGNVIIRN